MSMINCPECGKQISDKAKVCPKCGYPLTLEKYQICPECNFQNSFENTACEQCGYPFPKKQKINKWIIVLSAALIIISSLLIVILVGKPDEKDIKDEPQNVAIISEETDAPIVDNANNINEKQTDNAENVIEKQTNILFSSLANGDLETVQSLLDRDVIFLNNIWSIESEDVLLEYFSKVSAVYQSFEINENDAIAKIQVTLPDSSDMIDAMQAGISLSEGVHMTESISEKLKDTALKYKTETAYLVFKKIGEEWKIVADATFTSLLTYGITGEITIASLAEKEIKQHINEKYIAENIEILDYEVSICSGYGGDVPGLSQVSVKNKGDKKITSFSIKLDFYDEANSVVYSDEIYVMDMFDTGIAPGYSWKMQDNKFFEIENLPENVNLENVNVTLGSIVLEDVIESNTVSEEEQYIQEYLDLVNYSVGMKKGYSGTVPGIDSISVKNNGTRDISSLYITVYFQDESGKNIAEDTILLIGGLFDNALLKANYSWKMENGRFYELENLADEVDINRHTVEISEISFE